MPKLTAKFIENEVQFPAQGQVILRDDDLKGFGLRVSPNCISYIVECRIDGKVKRTTLGRHGFITAEEARREAQKMLTGIAFAKHSVPIVTLNQILEEFLASRSLRPNTVDVFQKFMVVRRLRPNTIRNYTQITNRCLGDWLNLPITSLTRDMVNARHQKLTCTTNQGTSGEVQANMAMRILRTFLNFAASNFETADAQPIITMNPVRTLSQNRSWHQEPRRRVIIPDQRLGEWYRAVTSLRQIYIRDYLLLLILTGLRRNEAATLRWSDIDFEARTLTIRARIAKNKREHCLPLTDFLFLLLSHRKENRRTDSNYVFPGRRGGPIVEPKQAVSRVIEKSGCDFVLHDLRRVFITQAAKISIPHHIIKKLVNHVATTDVTDGYIVIDTEHLREPMNLINNRFLTLFGCNLAD